MSVIYFVTSLVLMFIIGNMHGCETESRSRRQLKRELRELRQQVSLLNDQADKSTYKLRSFFDPKPPFDEGR